MTTEEILEYNKMCAKFLGYKRNSNDTYDIICINEGFGWHLETMKFHSDWNWIMEVLIKIKKIVCESEFNYRFINALLNFEKEAVVQAINQFLIWYNENSNNR